MALAFQIFASPIGEILVAGTGYCVMHVMRGDDKHRLAADFRLEYDEATPLDRSGYIREGCTSIAAYLRGAIRNIDLAFQTGGTDFQRKVWHELRLIPYGETRTYGDIAKAIGEPEAFRAVANACGKNPVPLIVPCHRAVHKDSDMSGFSWGAEAKQFLLDLEQKAAIRKSADYVL